MKIQKVSEIIKIMSRFLTKESWHSSCSNKSFLNKEFPPLFHFHKIFSSYIQSFGRDLVKGVLFAVLAARTHPHHIQMAPFVHHNGAYLTLIALLANAPDELLAMGAEGRLSQEQGHEFVAKIKKLL